MKPLARNFRWEFLGGVPGLFLIAFAVSLAGCANPPEVTPDPTQTHAPNTPVPILLPSLSTPTRGVDPAGTDQAPAFSTGTYTHPGGLFSIPRPAGWAIAATDSTV